MNKYRVCLLISRVVIIDTNKVLLVKHEINNESGWVFPGGRVEEKETTVDAAIRECKEETGYDIEVKNVCYLQEYEISFINYFLGKIIGGNLKKGYDPDIETDKQIIKDVKWIKITDLKNYNVYPKDLAKIIIEGKINNYYVNNPEVIE